MSSDSKTEKVQTENRKSRFTQIRVKSIEFLDKTATAVYFYDMTHHMESFKLENEIFETKNKNESLVNDQLTVSHEFRTPLSTVLMFMESLL